MLDVVDLTVTQLFPKMPKSYAISSSVTIKGIVRCDPTTAKELTLTDHKTLNLDAIAQICV